MAEKLCGEHNVSLIDCSTYTHTHTHTHTQTKHFCVFIRRESSH